MAKSLLAPLAAATVVLFAIALVLIAQAPPESTMGLVQKIFYFHLPSWLGMYSAIFTCGVASILVLAKGSAVADRFAVAGAELAVLFGANGLVTGPLWARKAWGVWWTWEVRLVSALLLWLVFVAYLIVRRYAGPGSDKLAAAVALFGTAVSPFVYISVNFWRTMHPKTTVLPTLPTSMGVPMLFSCLAFMALFGTLLAIRVRLAERETALDALYLAYED